MNNVNSFERTLLEKQKLIDISIALTSETDLNRLLSRIVIELRQLTSARGAASTLPIKTS